MKKVFNKWIASACFGLALSAIAGDNYQLLQRLEAEVRELESNAELARNVYEATNQARESENIGLEDIEKLLALQGAERRAKLAKEQLEKFRVVYAAQE